VLYDTSSLVNSWLHRILYFKISRKLKSSHQYASQVFLFDLQNNNFMTIFWWGLKYNVSAIVYSNLFLSNWCTIKILVHLLSFVPVSATESHNSALVLYICFCYLHILALLDIYGVFCFRQYNTSYVLTEQKTRWSLRNVNVSWLRKELVFGQNLFRLWTVVCLDHSNCTFFIYLTSVGISN
jgi:hypothetical protein